MTVQRASAILALMAVALGGAAGRAGAATTEIGSVSEIRAGQLPSSITAAGFAVQVAEATGTYAVPAGYGTITAWSHSAGTAAGTLTFKVYRPAGGLREFVVVGSDTQTVTAGSVQTFPVQIPVRPGDRIGLSSDVVELAYESGSSDDRIGFFGSDPATGATDTTDGEPFQEYKLDVAATLESGPSGAPVGPAPASGPPPYPIAVPRPAITRLRIAPGAFAAGSSATRVSYRSSVAAKVHFGVLRLRPGRRKGSGASARCVRETKRNRSAARCTRRVAVKGGFAQMASAGSNRFRFTGRLAGRSLEAGRYRLMATPAAAGRTGKPTSRGFRIIR